MALMLLLALLENKGSKYCGRVEQIVTVRYLLWHVYMVAKKYATCRPCSGWLGSITFRTSNVAAVMKSVIGSIDGISAVRFSREDGSSRRLWRQTPAISRYPLL